MFIRNFLVSHSHGAATVSRALSPVIRYLPEPFLHDADTLQFPRLRIFGGPQLCVRDLRETLLLTAAVQTVQILPSRGPAPARGRGDPRDILYISAGCLRRLDADLTKYGPGLHIIYHSSRYLEFWNIRIHGEIPLLSLSVPGFHRRYLRYGFADGKPQLEFAPRPRDPRLATIVERVLDCITLLPTAGLPALKGF